MDSVVTAFIFTFLTFLLAGCSLPAEETQEEQEKEKEEEQTVRLNPGLVARLNTSTFTTCSSTSFGSKAEWSTLIGPDPSRYCACSDWLNITRSMP